MESRKYLKLNGKKKHIKIYVAIYTINSNIKQEDSFRINNLDSTLRNKSKQNTKWAEEKK